MAQVSRKPGGDITRQEIQAYLQGVAEEINARLSPLDVAASQELLAGFVSSLFLSTAQKAQGETRRQRQAEGIAAAKARGTRFGRSRNPLPENFEQCREAWQSGEMTLSQAASACGMVRTSFQRAVARVEQAEQSA